MSKKEFSADVGRVLDLMINSIYTNKDIFLRELISNASDACDKLRYLSNLDSKLSSGSEGFKITITLDKKAQTLAILDTGIGMTMQDAIDNLGTIAHSGTKKFLDNITDNNKKNNELIGQFGVGFYSAFMVADKVQVMSKKAGEKKAVFWESEGKGEYEVKEIDWEHEHGTQILLHIREEQYLDHFKIKNIIKTYSDRISIPIYFIEEDKSEVQVNAASALWSKPKNSITAEQYKEFYQNIGYMGDDPWVTLHNRNEGMVEFTNLLFIPSTRTFDLFHPDRQKRVKLYINRVFITDENIDLIPSWLRFLRGIVDTQDLPLNISRETLQHNPVLTKIKNAIIKKVLNALKDKKKNNIEEYITFWNNFGVCIKEGLCEHNSDVAKDILDVAMFYSANLNKYISLQDYIDNAPSDGKKIIYYLSGDSIEKLKTSPQIEGILGSGVDVLLLNDHVDDFWVNLNTKYQDYEIKSATRSEIEIPNQEDKNSASKEEDSKGIIDFCKKVLGSAVKDVVVSKKLKTSPACLTVKEGDMDIRMEQFLRDQKQVKGLSAKVLEINTNHALLKKIIDGVSKDPESVEMKSLVNILFDQACILEGEDVRDMSQFIQNVNNLIVNK